MTIKCIICTWDVMAVTLNTMTIIFIFIFIFFKVITPPKNKSGIIA